MNRRLPILLVLVAAAGCYTPGDQPDPPRGDKEDREVARVYNRHVGANANPQRTFTNVRVDITRYEFDAADAPAFEAAWKEVGLAPQETLAPNGLRIGSAGNRFLDLLAQAAQGCKSLHKKTSWLTVPDGQRTSYAITPAFETAAFEYQDAGGIQQRIEVHTARLRLELAPECLPDRTVRLTITPAVVHVEKTDKVLPLADLQTRLRASDGEAIVIGPAADAKAGIGAAFLGEAPGHKGVVTLLVLKPYQF